MAGAARRGVALNLCGHQEAGEKLSSPKAPPPGQWWELGSSRSQWGAKGGLRQPIPAIHHTSGARPDSEPQECPVPYGAVCGGVTA